MPKTYTLTVTAEQATVIEQACELLARCSMGQFDHILWGVNTVAVQSNVTDARERLDDASRQLFGTGTGIVNTDAQGKRAWDLYQVVRQRLAVDGLAPGEKPDGTVRFNTPMNTAGEAFAEIAEVPDAD
jgi:hypothetical protein